MENSSLTINSAHAGSLLADLYARYHHPEYIHPDPLELVRRAEPAEREVTAIIASSLALGRVDLILAAARRILETLEHPTDAVVSLTKRELLILFGGFRYRFFSDEQLSNFLVGVGAAIRCYGSLEACFCAGMKESHPNTLDALHRFVSEIRALSGGDIGILLSDPSKGSASKRLHLFLRWMVRSDAVDPGGWRVSARKLVVPADVHMVRVSRLLGFTSRKQPDLASALEITAALSKYCPDDPVRFDFSMTRLGIHPELTYEHLYNHNS